MVVFEQAQRVHLSQIVFDQLLAKIRGGVFRPGDRLPGEYELMQQLGVGRSSVREAMRGLVVLGLVETKAGRGAVVLARSSGSSARLALQTDRSLQRWAILDLLEVREGLEGMAAQLTAERATPDDLAAIERAEKAVEARIAAGRHYFRANVEFHLAIARASHNNLLTDTLRYLLRDIRLHRERSVRDAVSASGGEIAGHTDVLDDMHQTNPSTVIEHQAILRAVRQRSAGEARQAMVEHIQHSAKLIRDAQEFQQHTT